MSTPCVHCGLVLFGEHSRNCPDYVRRPRAEVELQRTVDFLVRRGPDDPMAEALRNEMDEHVAEHMRGRAAIREVDTLRTDLSTALSRVAELEAERDGALGLLAELRAWCERAFPDGRLERLPHAGDCIDEEGGCGKCLAYVSGADAEIRLILDRTPIPERGARILEVVEAARALRDLIARHPDGAPPDATVAACVNIHAALRHLDATPVKEG